MADQKIQKKSNSLIQQAAVKVFPILRQERTQTFLIVVLTLVGLIIFGLFAISPTITTIIQLRKQLADNKLVQNQLQEKITNLSILQGKYDQIQPDLSLVLAAAPASPNIPELIGKIQNLAMKNKVNIISIQSNPINLPDSQSIKNSTVPFSFTLQGNRTNILNFITGFMSFDRLVTIDEIAISTITTTDQVTLTQVMIQGKAIFKPL